MLALPSHLRRCVHIFLGQALAPPMLRMLLQPPQVQWTVAGTNWAPALLVQDAVWACLPSVTFVALPHHRGAYTLVGSCEATATEGSSMLLQILQAALLVNSPLAGAGRAPGSTAKDMVRRGVPGVSVPALPKDLGFGPIMLAF